MRALLLVVLAACGGAVVRAPAVPHELWRSHVEPRLGVRVEVGAGWGTAALDDALLITPPGGEDFAIVVVRGRVQLDDAQALARLGVVVAGALADTAPPREGLATSVRAGAATLARLSAPVGVRLARIRDRAGRYTFVGAAIAVAHAERGESAFAHVVRSLALVEPTPLAREPGPPRWLDRGPPREPAEPIEDPEDSQ